MNSSLYWIIAVATTIITGVSLMKFGGDDNEVSNSARFWRTILLGVLLTGINLCDQRMRESVWESRAGLSAPREILRNGDIYSIIVRSDEGLLVVKPATFDPQTQKFLNSGEARMVTFKESAPTITNGGTAMFVRNEHGEGWVPVTTPTPVTNSPAIPPVQK